MDFSGTFDTTNALSGMFLWIIFGFLSVMVNCDLQRFMREHPVIFHIIGLVAFFFLFALLDTNNKTTLGIIWFKAVFIYILFVCMTKAKWYFVVPVLALLLLDQSLKKDLGFRKAQDDEGAKSDFIAEKEAKLKIVTSTINQIVIILIVVGTVHYIYLQKLEYKNKFSWEKFFGFGKCKSYMPNYDRM